MISTRFDFRFIEGCSGNFLNESSFHIILWIAQAGFTVGNRREQNTCDHWIGYWSAS